MTHLVFEAMHRTLDAELDERAVVLVAHGLIELMINTLVEVRCKNPQKILANRMDFTHSAKLLILNECGYLSDRWYQTLDRFRKLRNRAAHEPFFAVTSQDINHIAEPLEKDLPELPEGFTKASDSLGILCATLLFNIWSSNQDVLSPRFGPNLNHTNRKSS